MQCILLQTEEFDSLPLPDASSIFLVAPETPAEDPYVFPFNDVRLFLVEADLLMRTRQHLPARFQMEISSHWLKINRILCE
jgi:hypothetical protein